MCKPKITVVTITYNAEKVLENTILSVVNQTYENIEYIIIDGASTDGTIDIIKKYQSRINLWKSEPDNGIYDAMNKGIKLATGDWINFINAGDKYNNDSVLSNFISKIDSSTIIAYGDINKIFSWGVRLWKPFPLTLMKERMCFGHPATFVRVSYHSQHLFDISYRSSADYKMFFDAYYKDEVVFQYIPQIVADFEAEGGISSTQVLLVERENARLRGIDGTLKWKFRYFCLCVIVKFVPKRVLDARRQRRWRKMQRKFCNN